MIRLALIRHGPTAWNAEKRLQGRADIPLSETGRARVSAWRLPDELDGVRWFTSPLTRARDTADLLGLTAVAAPALVEMDFGAWEGRYLAELRAENPLAVAANEARGLDFRPPGGESPRMVRDRLHPWLVARAAGGVDVGAVTHKGVIRALLTLATGWDMIDKPPVRLDWSSAHLFQLDASGTPVLDRVNVPLEDAG
ncbi:MAG: histidine phosphatase family protein [Alphaproteobacteria bacterium]|nr:histidine phosphatase family protein [Alphaproteobacteria bacterium]